MLGGVAASVLFASAASAADIAPLVIPPIPVIAPVAPTTLSAYIEAFAGLRLMFDNGEVETLALEGPPVYGFGGAAHLAWQPGPAFSIQTDAWAERWYYGEEPFHLWGVAGHATFRTGNLQVGSLASVGYGYFGGTYVNLGGEAALNADRLRVYTQGGYIFAIGGSPLGYGSRDVYSQTVVTFYPRPNVALSVNAGADYYWERDYIPAGDYSSVGLNIGTRFEFQPEGRRFGVFAAYQLQWRNEFNHDLIFTTHVVGLGISLMLGQPDIRSRDRAIGLADNNPMFGPTFPP
ncbi:MAG: hypothetical protein KIS68_09930 [Bauldia sp.]|nr:hypothetical protein [Bauldia sp.]